MATKKSKPLVNVKRLFGLNKDKSGDGNKRGWSLLRPVVLSRQERDLAGFEL